jgi:hypothetical protein
LETYRSALRPYDWLANSYPEHTKLVNMMLKMSSTEEGKKEAMSELEKLSKTEEGESYKWKCSFSEKISFEFKSRSIVRDAHRILEDEGLKKEVERVMEEQCQKTEAETDSSMYARGRKLRKYLLDQLITDSNGSALAEHESKLSELRKVVKKGIGHITNKVVNLEQALMEARAAAAAAEAEASEASDVEE